MSLNPQSIFVHSIHFNLARLYLESQKTERAVEHLKLAVGLQPANPYDHNMLGIAYGKEGLYDDAVKEFEMAVRLAPGEAASSVNLQRALDLRAGAAHVQSAK